MLARDDTSAAPYPRWDHQQRALDRMRGRRGFALFMDMRTGKSKVVLDEWAETEATGEATQLLVVAPAGVYRTWEVAAREHLPPDLLRRTTVSTWAASSSQKATEKMGRDLGRPGPKILLVNVEALSTVQRAQALCLRFLQAAPTTLVVDESTSIKDHRAKRTRFCLRMAGLAKLRRILSGLPSPQSPLDLYSQLLFLDQRITGHGTFASFRATYAVTERKPFGPGRRFVDVVTGYKNLDDLRRRVEPHSFRVRLGDCYDLPLKMYVVHQVGMTEEQRRIYDQVRLFATATLEREERVTATMVLVQILRLHQVLAGHAVSDSGTVYDVPENKTKTLLEILEMHPGKAVIWVAYDRSVDHVSRCVSKVYGARSVARFWGGNLSKTEWDGAMSTREDDERRFLTDPECRFMIATAASGGRGRTWAQADLMIYYSNTHSLEHRLQSEERAQAVGKRDRVAYYDLVCPGTVEEKILQTLRSKISLSDAVTGDNWREWVV